MLRRMMMAAPAGGGGTGTIFPKLTCFWPLDTASGAVMASTQPEAIANGPEKLGLFYSASAPAAGSGRSAGRYAPVFSGQGYVSNNNNGATANTAASAGDFCLFGWVKVPSTPTSDYTSIVTQYDASYPGTTAGVGIRFRTAGGLQGFFSDGSADQESALPAGSTIPGEWMFLCFQRRNDKIRLSLNATTLAPEKDVTGKTPRTQRAFFFGSQGNYLKLQGQLQDWGWSRDKSLTDAEIAWLYNAGAGRTYAEIVSG